MILSKQPAIYYNLLLEFSCF